jgi:AspBHI-like restriction endonuclease/restriction endonuclease
MSAPDSVGEPTRTRFKADKLGLVDLVIDAIYEGRRAGNAGDDPLHDLIGVSNQGGFRYLGHRDRPRLIVLTSSFNDPDWPDNLDRTTGILTYFGDNKHPGRALHDTPRHGNRLLQGMFDAVHARPARRQDVPPILVFASAGPFRDMTFVGLAVPGTPNLQSNEDLVAVWKSAAGQRFQNYRAALTILDVPSVSRAWLRDIVSSKALSVTAPPAWTVWVENGSIRPLTAEPATEWRNRPDQVPTAKNEVAVIRVVYEYFKERPVGFEACAAKLTQMMDGNFYTYDLTRPSRDGGRDAIGRYRVGLGPSAVHAEFALEAKCYSIENSVGVRELSRLISRLRHRQFGVLVTTSFLNLQAYRELKEDAHPIVVIAAKDIVNILAKAGFARSSDVLAWLQSTFPKDTFGLSP